MRRREFIGLVGGTTVAWPLVAGAQQTAMPVIGFLSATAADSSYEAAFRQGLAEAGYTEGRNVAIEFHWAEGKFNRLPALASDLVQRRVAGVAPRGLRTSPAAQQDHAALPAGV